MTCDFSYVPYKRGLSEMSERSWGLPSWPRDVNGLEMLQIKFFSFLRGGQNN